MTPLDPEYFLWKVTQNVHDLEEVPEVVPTLVEQLRTTFGMPYQDAIDITEKWWQTRLSISINNSTRSLH